jgi:hypothetical protein
MIAQYAPSYIDSLFARQDLLAIHQVITVVEQTRSLPEEFWLFCRIYEWAPGRSGIWQYYEGLPEPKFERIGVALDRFGLHEIAQRYRSGHLRWADSGEMASLDAWLDGNCAMIHASVFALIRPHKDLLKHER